MKRLTTLVFSSLISVLILNAQSWQKIGNAITNTSSFYDNKVTGTEAERTATIMVTAENGTNKTYKIIFTVTPEAGKDATLSNPAVGNGALSPDFTAGIENYTVTLLQGTTDLSGLDAGIYLIGVQETNGKMIMNKIIKQ